MKLALGQPCCVLRADWSFSDIAGLGKIKYLDFRVSQCISQRALESRTLLMPIVLTHVAQLCIDSVLAARWEVKDEVPSTQNSSVTVVTASRCGWSVIGHSL